MTNVVKLYPMLDGSECRPNGHAFAKRSFSTFSGFPEHWVIFYQVWRFARFHSKRRRYGVVVVELINCKCGLVKLWDFSGYSEKSNIQEASLLKGSISGQIVSKILPQLCSDDPIQITINLPLFLTLWTESIFLLWRDFWLDSCEHKDHEVKRTPAWPKYLCNSAILSLYCNTAFHCFWKEHQFQIILCSDSLTHRGTLWVENKM